MTDSRGCEHEGTKVETASNRLNGVADPEGATLFQLHISYETVCRNFVAMSGASNGETSSSSSTSQNLGTTSESAVGSVSVPTRKRNRSIVVSDKYSQLVDYEVAPAEFSEHVANVIRDGGRSQDSRIHHQSCGKVQSAVERYCSRRDRGARRERSARHGFLSVFEPCVLRVSRSARPSGVYKVSWIFE